MNNSLENALRAGIEAVYKHLPKPGGSSRGSVAFMGEENGVFVGTDTFTVGQTDGTSKNYKVLVTVTETVDDGDAFWGSPSPDPDLYQLPFDVPQHQRVVVDNHFYVIEPDLPPEHSGLRGFGGRRFDIEFFDGRRVTSHNLWSQGTVPPKWREAYPDNAVFAEDTSYTDFAARLGEFRHSD